MHAKAGARVLFLRSVLNKLLTYTLGLLIAWGVLIGCLILYVSF